MKILGTSFLIVLFFFNLSPANCQDTLDINTLSPLSYSFNLYGTNISGEGATFLRNEIRTSQFTILGDYPNSKNTADFTKALLPELNQLNYKTIAVDIGPISTHILGRLPSQNNISEAIKELNDQYGFKEKDRIHLPMPILSSVEESGIIATAIHQDWDLVGLNNDSWNGLNMLLDELYYNLSKDEKQRFKSQYEEANQDLNRLYNERNADLLSFAHDFKKSISIKTFMEIASKSQINSRIIESIDYSISKSEQYAKKAYFEKNRDRIPYEKQLLRGQLESIGFDISKDKLLVKANRRHSSKGFQPDGFYGFSNTLYELATFYGNKSIHIGFFRRYYTEDGQEKDEMDNDYYVRNRYKDIIQMGKRDEWTIIDLRPLIEGSYYSQKYTLSTWIQDLMKQYDLIIIPPTDSSLSPNHSF